MKVSTRLVVGFGLLLLLMTGLVAFNVSALSELLESNRRLTRISSALHLGGSQLQSRLQSMDEFARKFAATGDTAYARRFGDLADSFDASLEELETLSTEIGGIVPRQVARLEDLWTDFRPVVQDFRSRTSSNPVEVARAAEPVVGWVVALQTHTAVTTDQLREAMRASVEASAARTRRTERISWIAAGTALLITLAVAVGLVRSIGGGLGRLSEGTRRVAEGDLDHRLDTDGAPEFSHLATSFNEMTHRLQKADQLKRDFFAHVSHDLKSPLSGMLDAHDLLLDETAGPLEEDQERLLRLSRESGTRLRRMIDLLLDLARFDAGVTQLEMEEIDLASLARTALREHEPQRRKTGVEWELDIPEDGIRVSGARSYLRRTLDNLLMNALEYSPEGGRVRVTVRSVEGPNGEPEELVEAGEWLEVTVSDEGPGVDLELADEIFDRFVRGEGPGGSMGNGLGLGLAFCREVTEAHGGEITADEAPGGGTRIRLLLPRRGEPA